VSPRRLLAALTSWRRDDYRSRNDRISAWRILRLDPPAVDTRPGSDDGLLEDAYLALYGHAGFQRLRDAIHQHRKENPQP
jgi:hypothetical protein